MGKLNTKSQQGGDDLFNTWYKEIGKIFIRTLTPNIKINFKWTKALRYITSESVTN